VAFGQGDLVEPEHGQRRERRPIDPARDVAIEDAFELALPDLRELKGKRNQFPTRPTSVNFHSSAFDSMESR
jgi:hypothetical protein